MLLTKKDIKKLLRYDKETGEFFWKVERHPSYPIGSLAGSQKIHGYVAIGLYGKRYYAHRLAWIMVTGKWPTEIDHINGIRNDNRWSNLRECTRQQNNGNRTVQKKHKHRSLPRGVILSRNKNSVSYNGRIILNNKQIHLGAYKTPKEAGAAYVKAAKKYFGEFARSE